MFLSSEYYDIVSMLCPWTGTSPSNASLDSGENEYLVGRRSSCVREVKCAEMAARLYVLRGVALAYESTSQVIRE